MKTRTTFTFSGSMPSSSSAAKMSCGWYVKSGSAAATAGRACAHIHRQRTCCSVSLDDEGSRLCGKKHRVRRRHCQCCECTDRCRCWRWCCRFCHAERVLSKSTDVTSSYINFSTEAAGQGGCLCAWLVGERKLPTSGRILLRTERLFSPCLSFSHTCSQQLW